MLYRGEISPFRDGLLVRVEGTTSNANKLYRTKRIINEQAEFAKLIVTILKYLER